MSITICVRVFAQRLSFVQLGLVTSGRGVLTQNVVQSVRVALRSKNSYSVWISTIFVDTGWCICDSGRHPKHFSGICKKRSTACCYVRTKLLCVQDSRESKESSLRTYGTACRSMEQAVAWLDCGWAKTVMLSIPVAHHLFMLNERGALFPDFG